MNILKYLKTNAVVSGHSYHHPGPPTFLYHISVNQWLEQRLCVCNAVLTDCLPWRFVESSLTRKGSWGDRGQARGQLQGSVADLWLYLSLWCRQCKRLISSAGWWRLCVCGFCWMPPWRAALEKQEERRPLLEQSLRKTPRRLVQGLFSTDHNWAAAAKSYFDATVQTLPSIFS